MAFILLLLTFCLAAGLRAAPALSDDAPLELPAVGACQLRVLAPSILELTRVTTKDAGERPAVWDFVDDQGGCRLPRPEDFSVSANGTPLPVEAVGFRRRVLYACFKNRDLRIGNFIYLRLAGTAPENARVEVTNPGHRLWPADLSFVATNSPARWSPVLHVNQTGYLAAFPKRAMIGYYLGSLGELDLESAVPGAHLPTGRPAPRESADPPIPPSEQAATPGPLEKNDSPLAYELLEADSNKEVYRGALRPRHDHGFPFSCYQKVFEADFSDFRTPGTYRLRVPGLGVSYPFVIDDALAGAFARCYALGLYHQRCGEANALPFTRFTHAPCHLAPAEVPDGSDRFASVNASLAKESANFNTNPRHTAPQLKNVSASLYPFVNPGPVDVHGGHHDAGDYSKYTINSAALIHYLVFAADVFPGVAQLDNLGLPESGDGKSDVLQEAKLEADFLARMQDADGGFYFLVYPRDREYEVDVLPDHGDPQVVFPKTTSATAAAVAALAQCASSPTFKRQFPAAAALYLAKARKGWAFLERAIAKFGKDGAYQKITHYGDDFMHDDELTWAACELYLATGEPAFHQKFMEWCNPADPDTWKWGWWRMYASYGCAIRSYAFAAKDGRLTPDQLNPLLRERCEAQIAAAGQDQLQRAQNSAYGTSFPLENKRFLNAGWYFSSDAAFDLAVAYQLHYPEMNDPRPKLLDAILTNLNYEQGCNPVNVTYLTGLGWKRQREIVDQYAQNDRRVLPPSGIPLGNIQAGFGWLWNYKDELGRLSFPADGAPLNPYPFYDRWGDSFNLSQEFIAVNQARALGYLCWLMARTPLATQPWRSATASISGLPAKARVNHPIRVELLSTEVSLAHARIVWEAQDQQPAFGSDFTFTPSSSGDQWLEAEAQLPDGRRVFAVTNFVASRW